MPLLTSWLAASPAAIKPSNAQAVWNEVLVLKDPANCGSK